MRSDDRKFSRHGGACTLVLFLLASCGGGGSGEVSSPHATGSSPATAAAAPAITAPVTAVAEPSVSPAVSELVSTTASAADYWSNPQTWNGATPAAETDVVIPAGKTVYLDVSPPPIKTLTVDGTLIFLDRDISLTADNIMVHGRLEIGSEAAPFTSRAVITLRGAPTDVSLMGMGSKLLGVMGGGVLDIHGAAPTPTWVRLVKNATPGTQTLYVDNLPNWKVGDRIVISSTDYDAAQAEVATIASISGYTVQLTAPLKYLHWGEVEAYDPEQPFFLQERAEVGLLTRNIVVRGDDSSATSGFGGQVMIHGTGVARIENAEFTLMGQKGRIGRYPLHFHLNQRGPESYIRGNSIHRSFNRCVTVHGTHGVRVTDNVAYDALGHCYFLEDGIETKNVFERNLGLLVRKPKVGEHVLPSDISLEGPAVYWITNPDNIVRNNAAAGSEGTGFWYALPVNPTGLSKTSTVWPRRTPLGAFENNVSHSNADSGLFVDKGPRPDGTLETAAYAPSIKLNSGNWLPVKAEFRGLLTYKNRVRGAWVRGWLITVSDAVIADSAIAFTFANDANTLKNSRIIGESRNMGTPAAGEATGTNGRSLPLPKAPQTPLAGFEQYDGPNYAENVSFYNYTPATLLAKGIPVNRPAGAFSALRYTSFFMHPENTLNNARYLNANQVHLETRPFPVSPNPAYHYGQDGYRSVVMYDKTGSTTGTADSYIVTHDSFLLTNGCRYVAKWNADICGKEPFGQLYFKNLDNPGVLRVGPLTLTRKDNGSAFKLRGTPSDPKPNSHFPAVVLANRQYDAAFDVVPKSMEVSLRYRKPGDWATVSLAYPHASARIVRSATGAVLSPVNTLSGLNGSNYYFDAARKLLHVKLVVPAGTHQDVVSISAQ